MSWPKSNAAPPTSCAPCWNATISRPATKTRCVPDAVTKVGKDASRTWPEYVDHVADYFPVYVPMFEALENMAPAEDRAAHRSA